MAVATSAEHGASPERGSGEENRDYYAQNLGQVWTFPGYAKYETARWTWADLPFSDDFSRREYWHPRVTRPVKGASVLEVGSAMGAAYEFMKNSGLVDASRYTGIEVSDMGHQASRRRFPEANWVRADFTRYPLERRYDYVFERIAVHHMPDPLAQFRKLLAATNVSLMTTFRGCLRGATVSDLSKAYFHTREDKYFCNIINLFEVLDIGLQAGFRHVRVVFAGLHEPIGSDPAGHQYLDPAIAAEGRMISRFRVRFSRLPAESPPMIYATVARRRMPIADWMPFLKLRAAVGRLAAVHEFSRV